MDAISLKLPTVRPPGAHTSAVLDFVAVLTGLARAPESASKESITAASPSSKDGAPSLARYFPNSISSETTVPSGFLKYGKGAGGPAGAASYISKRTVNPSLKHLSTSFTIVTSELLLHCALTRCSSCSMIQDDRLGTCAGRLLSHHHDAWNSTGTHPQLSHGLWQILTVDCVFLSAE